MFGLMLVCLRFGLFDCWVLLIDWFGFGLLIGVYFVFVPVVCGTLIIELVNSVGYGGFFICVAGFVFSDGAGCICFSLLDIVCLVWLLWGLCWIVLV